MSESIGSFLVVFIVLLSLGVIIYNAKKKIVQETENDKEVALRRQQDELRRKQMEYDANQQMILQRIQEFIYSSNGIFQNLPNEVDYAKHSVDKAEREFTEGAFAPFWDAIELTATHLARFDSGLQQIRDNFHKYSSEKEMFDSTPPPFSLDFKMIPNVKHIVDSLDNVVRLAQKDFHFATIYEQRKTNQLLVEGFTSLGEALNDMTYRITTSINDLSCSIYDLTSSNRENFRELIDGVDSLRNQMQSDAESNRAHEREERDMLNNIQRGQKPLF